MDIQEVSSREFRDNQASFLNQVCFGKKHIMITRQNKKLAVIISPEEFEILQAAMEALEDKEDLHEATKALKEAHEKGTISLEQLKKDLDIDV